METEMSGEEECFECSEDFSCECEESNSDYVDNILGNIFSSLGM